MIAQPEDFLIQPYVQYVEVSLSTGDINFFQLYVLCVPIPNSPTV